MMEGVNVPRGRKLIWLEMENVSWQQVSGGQSLLLMSRALVENLIFQLCGLWGKKSRCGIKSAAAPGRCGGGQRDESLKVTDKPQLIKWNLSSRSSSFRKKQTIRLQWIAQHQQHCVVRNIPWHWRNGLAQHHQWMGGWFLFLDGTSLIRNPSVGAWPRVLSKERAGIHW